MNDHMQSVIEFHPFFAACFFLAWITKPRKKFSRGHICVNDMPVKPTPARKGGTWRADDIMVGGVMCDE